MATSVLAKMLIAGAMHWSLASAANDGEPHLVAPPRAPFATDRDILAPNPAFDDKAMIVHVDPAPCRPRNAAQRQMCMRLIQAPRS